MIVTDNVATYIEKMGISINAIAKKTGLSKNILYPSLSVGTKKKRELRADELLSICVFLDKNPMDFYENSRKEETRNDRDGIHGR